MKRATSRRVCVVAAFAVVLVGCGGLPGDYSEALMIEAGTNGVTSCSNQIERTVVAALFGVRNPGDESIEIRNVEAVDASFDPVEIFVVTIPGEVTSGFGTSFLQDTGGLSDALQTAWQHRSAPPAVIPKGTTGQLLVVLPPPRPPATSNYVYQFRITAAVGDESDTYDWESLQIIGSEESCDALRSELRD